MENRRFILIALLGVVLFFLYQAWQKDYGMKPPPPNPAAVAAAAIDDDIPTAPKPAALAAAPGETPAAAAVTEAPAVAKRIRVETDLYIAEIATEGGELRRVELKGYAVSKDKQDQHLALLDDRNGRYYVLQSGLASSAEPLVTHKTLFHAEQDDYRLVEGSDHVDVVLTTRQAGLEAKKVYRFKRGSYQIALQQSLTNTGTAAIDASPYVRIARTDYKNGDEPRFASTFTGVGFYEQKEPGRDSYRFVKTKLENLPKEPFEKQQQGGWIAMLQHYFVTAILPPPGEALTLSAKPSQQHGYLAQYVGAAKEVAPGAQASFDTGLYIGPKLQDSIGKEAHGLELTVDYGILTPIAEPLFWLLEKLHKLTGNWGWAIILLTVVVKLIMYKLSEAQYRSMAKMKKFAPKLQDIKERYGDDRERQQKAMMELYKKEGFNPLAGCWPLLVQFPVFIALYWVLLESVELRQVPFVLWLQDLTAPDPFYVLPVIFGITMFVQQKLSGNTTMDPMQQKIMNVMPIGMTAFFTFFQSGLVLYWVTSNLIGIAQQWFITRKLEREETAKVTLAKR
ncbi:membrane protein insertase YidC [Solimonas sp. K1W22B-7]|uniref:membrane protein insertase YidC n=1 Tax=Solimonas sp. K1W22B-7 TaxID=2303331 RepID=UPI000E330165|nr:membrane protein insertase YidC [Solimonas sp. K1W22B-7]AXQ31565.1 membrane protein insertase YidC [Solimonas sp. K1W22B-7]